MTIPYYIPLLVTVANEGLVRDPHTKSVIILVLTIASWEGGQPNIYMYFAAKGPLKIEKGSLQNGQQKWKLWNLWPGGYMCALSFDLGEGNYPPWN